MFTDRCCRRLSRLLAGVAVALGLLVASTGARAQIGACCLPTGGCIPNAAATQCQSLGGNFIAGGSCNNCFATVGCCVNGGCFTISLAHCHSAGGTPFGGGCTPSTSCAPSGACCDPAGGCFQSTQAQCPTPNQWIALALCSAEPCSPKGACCRQTVCAQTTKNECAAMGGSFFQGAGCVPSPCPQVRACCLPTGACTLVTAASQCNGTLPGGTSCTPNPCTSPRGACCLPTAPGGCVLVFQVDCPAGHQFTVGGSCATANCPGSTGACCFTTGCQQVAQAQCPSSVPFSPGVPCGPNVCPQPGACCTAAAGCFITFLHSCSGEWFAGVPCSPDPCVTLGACCVGAACTQTTQAQCSGHWFGNYPCSANPCKRGGCCNTMTGQCVHVYRPHCERPGLIFFGPGVPCGAISCHPGVGACCIAGSHVCVQTTKSQCNGTWLAGKPCAPNNPCCPPDYNGVFGADLLDIFDFLAAWFAGCP